VVRTPAYNNCVRRRHYAKTFGKEATEWKKVQTRTGVNRISKGDGRRELTYSCGTVSLTLEALTLALGALIGVSGDGVESADIRRCRDVVLALKVF